MIPSMAALAIGTYTTEPPAKMTHVSSIEQPFTTFVNARFNGPHFLDIVGDVNLLLELLKLCGLTKAPGSQICTPHDLFTIMERLGLVVCDANASWPTKMKLLEPFSVEYNSQQMLNNASDPPSDDNNSFEDKMRVHNSMFECLQVLKYPYLFVATFDKDSSTADYDGSGMNNNMTPAKIDYLCKLKPV